MRTERLVSREEGTRLKIETAVLCVAAEMSSEFAIRMSGEATWDWARDVLGIKMRAYVEAVTPVSELVVTPATWFDHLRLSHWWARRVFGPPRIKTKRIDVLICGRGGDFPGPFPIIRITESER